MKNYLDALADLDIQEGVVVSPGIFQGHQAYVPYLYAMAEDGAEDERLVVVDQNMVRCVFDITTYDMDTFHQLRGVDRVLIDNYPDRLVVTEERGNVTSVYGEPNSAVGAGSDRRNADNNPD